MNTKSELQRKRHNEKALQGIDVVKYTSGKDGVTSPESYSLQMLLASYYDGSSSSGIINPSVARVMHLLKFDELGFARALAPILQNGDWHIAFDRTEVTGMIVDWTTLPLDAIVSTLMNLGVENIIEFLPVYLEHVKEIWVVINGISVSLAGTRVLTRYTGVPAGLAHAISLRIGTMLRPLYQDLGYAFYRRQGIASKFQLVDPNGYVRKVCHSVWFTHPLMQASTEQEWEYLFNLKVPTDAMLVSTKTMTVPMQAIARKFQLVDPVAELRQAVIEINTAGWFHAEFFGDKDAPMDGHLVFTPMPKLHRKMWELECNPGGKRITAWEVANGHLPQSEFVEGSNPYVNIPKLAYHYLYLIKSYKTGEYISVGQTTQCLNSRLYQHKVYGTNGTAHTKIEFINNDPEDQLIIEPIGLVHNSVCGKMEMRALYKMEEKGHRLLNEIDTFEVNQVTIGLDTRLQAMSTSEQEAILAKTLETYGAVIFQNELPEVKVNN